MEQITRVTWKAAPQKVFKNKTTDLVGGSLIILGVKDDIANYIEIDKPIIMEEQENGELV